MAMVQKPERFDLASFVDPDTFFWPSYFWVWNDRLDAAEIVRQLGDMRAHGIRGVCVVPEPPEFRPDTMATSLEPEYLTPGYFEMVAVAVRECARLGMAFWLYDEGGWPSGCACGRVVAARPDLANCHLEPAPLPVREGAREWVIATAWREAGAWLCVPGYDAAAESREGAVAYVAMRQRSRGSGHPVTPDLLDPEATATFIGLTHERYAGAVGAHMGPGRPVDRAFTDEPSVPHVQPGRQVPWTRGLLGLFQAEKGYDLLPHLPALFADPSSLDRTETLARIDYFDVWSRRFVTAYLEPLRSWCREHDVLSAGHMGGEDETDGSAWYGFGHILRALRALDMPGVDAIWRQLFPGKPGHHFPKYASSVAHQAGTMAMTESFAVYGNGLTPAEMKWVIDYQWVRGISNLVGACYAYSTRDHFMFGERPHVSPVNPLWDGLTDLHAYVARLSYALSAGQPRVTTAAYFPVRDVWAGLSGGNGIAATHERLAETLLAAQCDFDYVDDDVLASGAISGGALAVGRMRYDTLVLQPAEWVPAVSVAAIRAFADGGGRLLCCDAGPRCDGEREVLAMLGVAGLRLGETARLGAGEVSLLPMAEVPSRLRPIFGVSPATPALRACCQESESGHAYFLVNEGGEHLRAEARFRESGMPLVLDAVGGGAGPAQEWQRLEGQVAVPLRLAPYESLLLWFPAQGGEQVPQRRVACREVVPGANVLWRLRPLCRYSMGERDFAIEHLSDAPPIAAALGDWQPFLGEDFSGQAEYTAALDWPGDDGEEAWLDLGEVCYVAEAWLNGAYVGKRLWQPFRFAVGEHLRRGSNDLRVVVTNTLANALAGPQGEALLHSRSGPGWPGPYDARAREFERQSLPSGLWGPVRLWSEGRS